jgi:N-acetyl sugar amidotransferase
MSQSETIICKKCVLDNDAPNTNLVLDADGICNNCRSYEKHAKNSVLLPYDEKKKELDKWVRWMKRDGKWSEYDCILGISGGVDSTYLAYLAKELGLRPLVVHFDNGWNSELAVRNIQNIVEKLGFELHTYVIDWEEFKDLQLSYLKASVVDIEATTDQFIYATLHEVAYKHRIKYVLDGNNLATEFWGVSWKWAYNKLDLVNLRNIHKRFGTIPLKKYPKLGFYQRFFYHEIYQLEQVYLLNYVNYNIKEVKSIISKELGWVDYGGKHYESIFTRFYQGYILPKKFGIDKRKAHLSNLIWSGQMTRDEALTILKEPPYPEHQQMEDREYVCKKFGITIEEFEECMRAAPVPHEVYGTENDDKRVKWHRVFIKVASISIILRFIRFLIRRKII